MDQIFKSASKIAFLMLMLTCCVGFMTRRLESKDFMVIASGASAFYFANKGSKEDNYLGK